MASSTVLEGVSCVCEGVSLSFSVLILIVPFLGTYPQNHHNGVFMCKMASWGSLYNIILYIVVMQPAGYSAVRGVGTNTYLISGRRKRGGSHQLHTPQPKFNVQGEGNRGGFYS